MERHFMFTEQKTYYCQDGKKYPHATQTQHVPNGAQPFSHFYSFFGVACLWNWYTLCPHA